MASRNLASAGLMGGIAKDISSVFRNFLERLRTRTFQANISNTPVFFFSFRDPAVAELQEMKRKVKNLKPRRVLFVDTRATPEMIGIVKELTDDKVQVSVVDHHRTRGNSEVRTIIGERARYSTRRRNPSCSSMIQVGEFIGVDVVVADNDPDGLLSTMKALGVTYPKLDSDAAAFDSGSPLSLLKLSMRGCRLLLKGSGLLKDGPERDTAMARLVENFANSVQGKR